MGSIKPLFFFLFSIYFFSCKHNQKIEYENTHTLFSLLNPEQSGLKFFNAVKDTKTYNIFKYRNFYNGGGVAIGDINNDGLPDVYLTSNMGDNKLFLNKGNLQFEDITVKAKVEGGNAWSTGAVMVDINQDGWLDIYVCNAGNLQSDNQKNELFINQKDLSFKQEGELYQIADSGFTTHAAFFDYDGDNDLDLYILNNSFIPVNSLNYNNKRDLRAENWKVPSMFKGGGDKLLENRNGKYVDVSQEAGIYGSLIGFGLGVTVGDINQDGWMDIYVSNDFYERDYLYINQKDGTFKEDITNWMHHLSLSSMGADMADINNDGLLDIFVTDMLPHSDERTKNTTLFDSYNIHQLKLKKGFFHQYIQNTLQVNQQGKHFIQLSHFARVAKTDWSWGALLFDMDNDGYKDIYVCNGIQYDLTNQDFLNFFANDIIQKMVLSGKKEALEKIINKMPQIPIINDALINKRNTRFEHKSKALGFHTPSFSNGAAYGDLDQDGDLDLVVNNVNQEAFVYRNNTDKQLKNHYLKVILKGLKPNIGGIGSKITLYQGKEKLFYEMMPSRGFQSSVDYTLVMGMGKKRADSLAIIWPNGARQTIPSPPLNQTMVLSQKDAKGKAKYKSPPIKRDIMFKPLVDVFDAHLENNYNDFDFQGLIYQQLSKEGPGVAVGDINGDGNDDIFIGGGKGQAGQIYVQGKNFDFKKINIPVLYQDRSFEDTAATFMDYDGDKDLDLLVGSGGNQVEDRNRLPLRIYENKGNNTFIASEKKIRQVHQNCAKIIANDFDSDGDMDVLVLSRSVPGIYGVNPKHLFLENDGKGNFRDITHRKAKALQNIGMVTDAGWADINQDGFDDIVLIGDWMQPTLLLQKQGEFTLSQDTGLEKFSGWWQGMLLRDLDGDKDIDILLGNQGLNFYATPSLSAPMKLFVNDFDNNGTIEQILTRKIDNRDKPIHMQKELTNQIVSLKKKNWSFSSYANKGIKDFFDSQTLASTLVKKAETFQSIVAWNNGNGIFTPQPLPIALQYGNINAIMHLPSPQAFNSIAIIVGGNKDVYKPQFSKQDALQIQLLKKTPDQEEFQSHILNLQGLAFHASIQHFMWVKSANGKTALLVVPNNDKPKLYQIQYHAEKL